MVAADEAAVLEIERLATAELRGVYRPTALIDGLEGIAGAPRARV